MLQRIQKCACVALLFTPVVVGLEKPGTVYKVFQFPADQIPRVDDKTNDWDVVPEDYVIGMDQLTDSNNNLKHDSKDIDVKVKVGWVKGLNRLFFLYEAWDDYWSFARPDQHNDMFEVAVDGNLSGGPFIKDLHPETRLDPWNMYRATQGVHAQNWHVFTPAEGKDLVMVWGCQQPWIRELPYGNAAYSYNFKHGGSGKLVLEFWLTPFDHADCDRGPGYSVESNLTENKIIGLAWAVKDYDDDSENAKAFWNLSPKVTMYGNASDLVAFRLMPLEARFRKPIEAKWSFKILDVDRKLVAFQDLSEGNITSWTWDFGDGTTSDDRHPIHQYRTGGEYRTVTLYVEGPAGKARRAKVFDVVLP